MTLEPVKYTMPFSKPISEGLSPGSWVMMEGFIPPQSKGFHAEFAYGQFEGAQVALKFTLRFEGPPSSPSAIVALSSFTDKQWVPEKTTISSFRQGQWFKMQFIVTSTGYKIMKNDKLLCEFAHRLPSERIRFLQMNGEVELKEVVYDKKRYSEGRRFGRLATHGGWRVL